MKRADLPTGVLIGTVDVVDCEQIYQHEDQDNRSARFAYLLADPTTPDPPKGTGKPPAADLVSSFWREDVTQKAYCRMGVRSSPYTFREQTPIIKFHSVNNEIFTLLCD